MKKVIQFIHALTMGGAETMVKDYCMNHDDDFEFIVLTTEPMGGYANETILLNNGVRIISLAERLKWKKNMNFIQRVIKKLFGRILLSKELLEVVREEKPDVIHVHLELVTYLVAIRKHLSGIKIFFTCHNPPSILLDGENRREGKFVKTLIMDCGMRIIALQPEMAEEINTMFNVNNTVVLNNGINFERFLHPKMTRDQVREMLEIPKQSFVIGHIGRFAEQKNHDFLVSVFKEFTQRDENSYLLMVGSAVGAGKLKQDIMHKIDSLGLSDRTICLENRSDIPELLTAIDVLVFPSLYEGFGNVLLEAQVAGVKCVVSDNVPNEVFLTDRIISLKLSESPKTWCDVIQNNEIKNEHITGNLWDYDMATHVVKELQKIYCDEI